MEKSIVVLIAAHFLGDFLLQPDWMIDRKKRFFFMLLHGSIHALLVYCLYQDWTYWPLPLTIFAAHLAIDFTKQQIKTDTAKEFAWDQTVHILSLAGIGWLLVRNGGMSLFSGHGYALIIGFAGFIATVQGTGYFVGKVVGRIKEQNELEIDGLENGGAWIGNLERALIFLLIFIGQPAGIGFLVAAKSILRFEEAKKQKLAEYVLIGTLMSFSMAIAIATATRWAMSL